MKILKIFKINVLYKYIGIKIYVIGSISNFRINTLFPVGFSEIRVLKAAYNIGKIN